MNGRGDLQPNTELEIAHVLFVDVVGYSARLINEQTAVMASSFSSESAPDSPRPLPSIMRGVPLES